ncbi:MAG: hypothetical protein IVW57_18800 [Ktedonobacterales bacterium]|nr:hypothetical protein [Ktedonobacterales bacterium]
MTVRTVSASRVQPDLYEWLGMLAPNALQVILGVDEAGELLCTTLAEAAPLRILSANDQARDRLVYSLLAQLFARNDPEALRVILLDLRQHFSTLFRLHAQTRLVASTRPALIQAMHVLHQELERRSSQANVAPAPWLIFVEEDLGLYQDEMTWQAFHALVAHGHEVGLHLLVASTPAGGLEDALEALPPFRSRLSFPGAGSAAVEDGRSREADVGFLLEREAGGGAQHLLPPSFDVRLLVHLAKQAMS